jgi:hypothetical protein
MFRYNGTRGGGTLEDKPFDALGLLLFIGALQSKISLDENSFIKSLSLGAAERGSRPASNENQQSTFS